MTPHLSLPNTPLSKEMTFCFSLHLLWDTGVVSTPGLSGMSLLWTSGRELLCNVFS